MKIIISDSYDLTKQFENLENCIYLPELTRGEYEMAYFIKEELINKNFDGTIITCSSYLINAIGLAIEKGFLNYKNISIKCYSKNHNCEFDSSYNEKGILNNWMIGFFCCVEKLGNMLKMEK